MKIYQAVARALLEHGVDTIFGLMGDANMRYVAEYRELDGRFVGTAHECGAVAAADGWSRATGRVAVATVTHGPGVTNTMTALVEAVRSRSRVLLLTGDTPPEPTHFQRLDIAAVARAAGAGYERVAEPRSLVRDLNRALQRVVGERCPVVLDLPAALLQEDAGEQVSVVAPVEQAIAMPVADRLDEALGLICSARRPVVLAGRGAVLAGARGALVALADRIAAPLATTVLAKDLFRGNPSDLGICGDLAHPLASGVLGEADCIIAFGAALNAHTTLGRELLSGKRVVQVDTDPVAFGRYAAVDEAVTGDARVVAEMAGGALEEIGHRPNAGWLHGVQRGLAARDRRAEFCDRSRLESIDARSACIRLDEVLPANRAVVSDIGRFVRAAWPHLAVSSADRFTSMGAFGSIGLGLAGAVGAAVARPAELTVCVVGDGGFLMNPAELTTAAREHLALLVVVFNDGAYGAEWHKLAQQGADPRHALVSWPAVAPVAEALGARTVSVRSIEEVDKVCPVSAEGGPVLLEVVLDPAVDITSGR